MPRPHDWGKRESHPLYDSWNHHRRKGEKGMVAEWRADFWKYVSGIGDKPTPRHRLKKHRANEPIGPDNFFWDETYFDGDRAKYMREYRTRRPDRIRTTVLKTRFGITPTQYTQMLNAQNGVCAICHKPQPKDNLSLAVDHCHTTGKVRGLLCSNCNRGIGMFKDDVSVLLRAVRYLSS